MVQIFPEITQRSKLNPFIEGLATTLPTSLNQMYQNFQTAESNARMTDILKGDLPIQDKKQRLLSANLGEKSTKLGFQLLDLEASKKKEHEALFKEGRSSIKEGLQAEQLDIKDLSGKEWNTMQNRYVRARGQGLNPADATTAAITGKITGPDGEALNFFAAREGDEEVIDFAEKLKPHRAGISGKKGLLAKFGERMEAQSPQLVQQRQEAFENYVPRKQRQERIKKERQKAFEDYVPRKQRAEAIRKQRQEIYEEPFEKKLTDMRRSFEGFKEYHGAKVAPIEEDAPEREKISRQLGKMAGLASDLIPYGVGFKMLGMGTKTLAKLAGGGLRGAAIKGFTHLAGANLIGRKIARGKATLFDYELSPEEERKAGLDLMAIDATLGAAGLIGQFSKAVGNIAKSSGLSRKQVLGGLWKASKNAGASFWEAGKGAVGGKGAVPGEGVITPPAPKQPKLLKGPKAVTLEEFVVDPKSVNTLANQVKDAEKNPKAFADRVSKEFPKSQALKVEKAAERPTVTREHDVLDNTFRKARLKKYNAVKGELDDLAQDMADKKEPGALAQANAEQRRDLARKELPSALKTYQEVLDKRVRLHDAYDLAPAKDKPRVKALLDRDMKLESQALAAIDALEYQRATGQVKKMGESLETQIRKVMESIKDASQLEMTPELYESFVKPYPKTLERLKKLGKKKPLPGTPKEDTNLFQMRKYQQKYDQRLKNLSQELKNATNPDTIQALKNERKILMGRRKDNLSKQLLQTRRHGLRGIKRAESTQLKLEGSGPPVKGTKKVKITPQPKELPKPKKQHPYPGIPQELKRGPIGSKGKLVKKFSKPPTKQQQKIFNEVGKNPSSENLSKASKETGIPKEEIKEARSTLKDSFEKMGKAFKDPSKGKASKLNRARKGAQEAFSKLFKGDLKGFIKTPFGLHFTAQLALGVLDDVLGVKIPYSGTMLTLLSRRTPEKIAAYIVVNALRFMIKKGISEKKVSGYTKALKMGSLSERAKAKENLSTAEIKKARERLRKSRG